MNFSDYFSKLTPEELVKFKADFELSPEEKRQLKSDVYVPYSKVSLKDLNAFNYSNSTSASEFKSMIEDSIASNGNVIKGNDDTDVYIVYGTNVDDPHSLVDEFYLSYYFRESYSYCSEKYVYGLEIYHIQVPPMFRKKGVANHVMSLLESLAKRTNVAEISVRAVISPELGNILRKLEYSSNYPLIFCKKLSFTGGKRTKHILTRRRKLRRRNKTRRS